MSGKKATETPVLNKNKKKKEKIVLLLLLLEHFFFVGKLLQQFRSMYPGYTIIIRMIIINI